jgi:hypothetical protein
VDIKRRLGLTFFVLSICGMVYVITGNINSAAQDNTLYTYFQKISEDKNTSLNDKNSTNIIQMIRVRTQ